MKYTDLKPNKYYIHKYYSDLWIFNFKKIKAKAIYINKYYIYNDEVMDDGDDELFYYKNSDIFEEISYDDFMKKVPNDHIDKIVYLRKQKIQFLLK